MTTKLATLRATEVAAIHHLLGDVKRSETFHVTTWVAAVDRIRDERSLQETMSGTHSFFELFFEPACAYLHHARALAAAERFKAIIATEHRPSARRVLARLGVARAHAALRRYQSAAGSIARALDDAKALENDTLVYLVRLLETSNSSDWDRSHEPAELATLELPTEFVGDLGNLLETYRILAVSRALSRRGNREEAMAVIDAWINGPAFRTVAAIPRGLILRWHGILQAQKGNVSQARSLLENAIALFRGVGYDLGEVQSVLSLARVHAPRDHGQAEAYLRRAKSILEKTDPLGGERNEGRQMPGERAQLNSRLADLAFTKGNFAEALALYTLDLNETSGAGAQPEERMPRPLGYIRRNLGRSLSAMKRWSEATEHLVDSVDLFKKVGDQINVVFSQVLLCEAYLESKQFRPAQALVDDMTLILDGQKSREKEWAMLQTLTASLIWRREADAERALGILQEVRHALKRHEPSYYDVRALVLESEILIGSGDDVTAVKFLREARRLAVNLDFQDQRIEIEALLQKANVPLDAAPADDVVGKKDLVILFADIRGFTVACQRVNPLVMAEFIAEFAGLVSRQISICDGRPTRFLGDCVMALFGLRQTRECKEALAVRAAILIWDRFRYLKEEWADKCPDLGEVGLGFGITSGEVIVGRFGSQELSEYSAIGAAVNLAARLQGAAEDGEVMMCQRTTAAVRDANPALQLVARKTELKGIGPVAASLLKAAQGLETLWVPRRRAG
jgi:class 3 adenylate cyclase